mgnify:FL=1
MLFIVYNRLQKECDIESEILPHCKFDEYHKQQFEKKIRDLSKTADINEGHKYLKRCGFAPEFFDVVKYVSRPFLSIRNGEPKEIKSFHFSMAGVLMQDPTEVLEQERIAQANEFIKQVQTKKKRFDDKIKAIEEKEAERMRYELEKIKSLEEELEQKKMLKRKLELDETIKKINMRKEERARSQAAWEEEYKKYQQKEPLYVQLEKKYREEVELPALEHKKQVLRQLRAIHRPIDYQELAQHEKHVLEKVKEMKMEQRRMSDHPPKRHNESMFHSRFEEELEKAKRAHLEEFEAKKKVREKMLDFAGTIKRPTPSKQKEMELKMIIAKLSEKDKGRRIGENDGQGEDKNESTISPRKKGLEYLELARKARKYKTLDEEKEAKKDDSNMKSLNGSVHHYPDYLSSVKKKKYSISDNWKHILGQKEMDLQTKKEQVLNEASRLEDKATMKEQLLRAHLDRKKFMEKYVEEAEEVNSMYLNSIEAKLSLLTEEIEPVERRNTVANSSSAHKRKFHSVLRPDRHSRINKSVDIGIMSTQSHSHNHSPTHH